MNIAELPGGEFIVEGLHDLEEGNADTVGAMLISIASQRLQRAGLNILPHTKLVEEPEFTLYDLLAEQKADSYYYYNALLRNLCSFCSALKC